MRTRCSEVFLDFLFPLTLLCCAMALAQNTSPKDNSQDAKEPIATFQSKVNLVLVPVVVRDAQGRPIGNLTKDDFQLFDKGKLQTIVSFSMVKRTGSAAVENTAPSTRLADSESAVSAAPNTSPERYLIYLFDDLNTTFSDMANVRASAVRHFKSGFPATDRAAIYTFSGRPNLEFTSDREKLEVAVSKLRWRPAFGHSGFQCPDINYYLADVILNKNDSQALQALTLHTAACAHVRDLDLAKLIALAAANRELIIGAQDTRVALRTIERAIRRLAVMPGQRLIVLASPGFFAQTPEGIRDTAEVLNQAAKANVIISTLGARGVYIAEEAGDVTQRGPPSKLWVQQRYTNAAANSDVMAELAEGTGGTFFRKNNDLTAGFERLATAPEFSYVLGFSPADLKTDGSFHSLKIRLPTEKGVSVEARRGYYALKPDPEEQAARSEIDEAVFSRNEITDIPVVVQTGYTKSNLPNADNPKVKVVTKVDVRLLHFKKADERSRDTLTVVLALFDPDGGYVMGATNTVNLRLRDETLSQTNPDVTLRSEFGPKHKCFTVK
jgi:VWFA-related protein